jgi:small-conductance mechanosensitive channel
MGALESLDWTRIGVNLGVFAGAVLGGLLLNAIIMSLLRRFAEETKSSLDDSIVRHCAGPLKLMVPLLAIDIVMPSLAIPRGVDDTIGHLIALLFITGVSWLIMRLALVVEDQLVERFRIDVPDNVKARRIRTQFAVFRRVLSFIVTVIAFGVALTTFEWARTIGASLLTSAGIVGLAASLAARPSIESLIAGLQLALTEPIRLDDVVIVENQWGRIEEITTTYVVVRIWDLRRLVLPISYFITKPFQNWTRNSADLLAYVYLNLDYRMPIEPLRKEFSRILDTSPRWDRKVCVVQVSDATEHTMQIRALASAANSSNQWDLNCEVREKLIDFVQRNYPQYLPRARADLDGELNTQVVIPNGHLQSAESGKASTTEAQ